jgi:hypothetical protein
MNSLYNILIIHRNTSEETLAYMANLALDEDVKITYSEFNTINVLLENGLPMRIYIGNNEIKKNDYNLIYSRTERTFLIDCLYKELTSTQFLQFAKPYRKSDKFWQYATFHQKQLPIPKSLGIFIEEINNRIDFIEEEFNYPLVVKGVTGAHGKSVYLANSRKELLDICQDNFDSIQPVVIQELIENVGDYRVIIVGFEYKTSFLRKGAEGEWRNNTSLGGEIIEEEISDKFRSVAEEACKILDYPLGGVDIIIDKKNPERALLLEVNPSFQITSGNGEYKEKAKYVTDYLIKLVKD